MTTRSSPLTVCHVIYRFDTGGLENGLVNLINHLPEAEFTHVIVTLSGFNPEFARRLNKNVRIVNVAKQPGKDFGVYYRLWRAFRDIRPDILHTRNLSAIEAQIPGFLAGIRYRIHGEHGWDISDPEGKVKKYQILRRYIGKLIHRFIPLSSHLETYLTERVGIPASKVFRICNGVDVGRFQDGQASSRSPELMQEEPVGLIFGSVGRLEKIKGHEILLEAFKLVKQQGGAKSVKLVLVGDGSQRAKLESFVRDNGHDQDVLFLGNRQDIPQQLQELNVFILPSLAEGISNTILEAMASGLPVLATRVGGNPDLVEHGVTGLLVKANNAEVLAEAMLQYIQHPDLVRAQGLSGRKLVEQKFSLEVMVENYRAVYLDKQEHWAAAPARAPK